MEGEGNIVLLCLTIERQRGDVREREAGSKDPRTAVDVMGFRGVGGQPVQWVCQHSGVKRGFPRTNVWRVLKCGEGECYTERKGEGRKVLE